MCVVSVAWFECPIPAGTRAWLRHARVPLGTRTCRPGPYSEVIGFRLGTNEFFSKVATEPPDGVTRNNPYSTASGSRAVLAACHIAYGMAWSHLQGSKPSFDNAPSLIGSSTRACCQRGLYEAVALIPSVFQTAPPLSRLIPSLPDTRSAARTSLELDLTGFFFIWAVQKPRSGIGDSPSLLPKRLLFLSPSCTVCCTWETSERIIL